MGGTGKGERGGAEGGAKVLGEGRKRSASRESCSGTLLNSAVAFELPCEAVLDDSVIELTRSLSRKLGDIGEGPRWILITRDL